MFYNWRKRRAMQQAAELRKHAFGVFDLSDGDAKHERLDIMLRPVTLYTNGDFARQKALVSTNCLGCGDLRSADFDIKYALSGVMKWADSECEKCLKLSEHRLSQIQAKLRLEDERKQEIISAIEASSGSRPHFTERGGLNHLQFRWISVQYGWNCWLPTWLSQDGSAEALQQLHELARVLKCSLHAHEGLLLFTPIYLMSRSERQLYAQEAETIQAHLSRKEAYQASKIQAMS